MKYREKAPKRGKGIVFSPSFRRKTSDILEGNIRTFRVKPRYFVSRKSDVFVFPAEKAIKRAVPDFAIFRNDPYAGGFRGPSQPIICGERIVNAC